MIPIIFLDFKIENSAWSVADTLNRDSILFRKIHENGFFSNPESIEFVKLFLDYEWCFWGNISKPFKEMLSNTVDYI